MANTIYVDLDVRLKKAEEQLAKIKGKSKKAGQDAGNSFSKGFGKSIKDGFLLGGGFLAITAGFRAIANQVSVATREIRGFERALAEVNSILPKNEKLTRSSVDTFKEFAGTFATSSEAQAKSFYAVVSAGIKGTATQLKTLESANEAAIAGLVDINDATRVLVSSVNSYSSSGLTAQEASDALFVAVREGQTTFGELADTLGNVTSIAQNAGVEFNELAGAVAFVTKSGIKTDIAVTGLRQVFASLIKPSKEAADEAKRIGLEFTKTAIQTKGLAGFLRSVQTATKGNETSLAKLFGNIRALAPVLNIVNGNFDDFKRILNETTNAAGATRTAADEVRKSLDFKLEKASANFALLRQEIAGLLTPALGRLAEKFTTLLRVINPNTSAIGVLEAKAAELSRQIKETEKDIISAGDSFFVWGGNADTLKGKLDILNTSFNNVNTELNALKKQEFLDTTNEGRLITANAELASLTTRLSEVKKGFLDIRGASQFGLELDIASKESEIMRLTELIAASKIKIADAGISSANALSEAQQRGRNSFEEYTKSMQKFRDSANKIINQGFTKTISNGIQTTISALAKGENALEAFAKSLLSSFGDLAIQLGEFYIAKGLADLALLSTDPSGEIATGAALVALGAILKSFSGGSAGSPSSGASAGAASSSLATDTSESPEVADRNPVTTFNIEVQGSLVQQEELGKFITDVQNEAREKNGILDTNVRVA